MGFGTPPTVISCAEDVLPCLEGDYSTWTESWEYDFPDGLNALPNASVTLSPDYLYILYYDISGYYRFVVIEIADASAVFTSPSDVDYIGRYPYIDYASFPAYNTLVATDVGGSSFSILGKYVLFALKDHTKFEVWKDGVKTFTSPLASDVVAGASTYASIGLRYDGKYVVAITDNKKLVCFEGS